MRSAFLFLIIFLLLMCEPLLLSAQAAPPIPERKAVSTERLQEELAVQKKEEAALKQNLKTAQTRLEKERAALVRVGENIQQTEKKLISLERRIVILTQDEKNAQKELEAKYGDVSNMVLALTRMRRTPSEALLARPQAPLQTAQSALLLEGTLPAVSKQADDLSADLERLSAIREELESDQKKARLAKDKLKEEKTAMSAMVAERRQHYKATEKDYQRTRARVKRLAQEAKNLQELMARLAEEEEQKRKARTAGFQAGKRDVRQLPPPGKTRLPVSGMLQVAYGQRDEIGARSQGIRILARSEALVTAPMGGAILFAGAFKNYRNMVIIEHQQGYHSLIAGLDDVQVDVGEKVRAGEPLGQLPSSSSLGGQPTLYYELRYKGESVDPANKFPELKN